jgi:hypothetical protein
MAAVTWSAHFDGQQIVHGFSLSSRKLLRDCIESFPCPERQGFNRASSHLRGRRNLFAAESDARAGGELHF